MKQQFNIIVFLLFLISLSQAKNLRMMVEEEFIYDGKYTDGKAEGIGIANFTNGNIYYGQFRE